MQLDRWTIRVPLGALPLSADYPLVHLTSSTSDKTCPKQFLRYPSRSTCALTRVANQSLTLSPTAIFDLAGLAKRSAPLMHVHVSTFADFRVVAFTVSHSVTDGKGLGLWAGAFGADLKWEEWEVSPVEAFSRVDEAGAKLQAAQGEALAGEVQRSVGEGRLLDGAGPSGVGAVAKMLGANAVERLWDGLEDQGAFIRCDVVA